MRRRTRGLLALTLVLAACSAGAGDNQPTTTIVPTITIPITTTTSPGVFPVTIAASNGPVEILRRPTAVISLSPTATEMLFAVGAGEQVVAADEYSDYPKEAPTTDLSGFTPNVEAVAAYRPDLVVISGDANDLVASLGALQIPVLVMPAATTLDDVYTQIEQLGAATGHVDEAAEVVLNMQNDVADIIASVPKPATPLTYYHELDPSFFSATSSTFIGTVYGLLGLQNIADPADADGFGYPQLSAEFIISADPDLIFLADTKCCAQNVATVTERPGWSEMSAAKNGGVVELDDDVASRWGPRIVDYLRVVADRIAGLVTTG